MGIEEFPQAPVLDDGPERKEGDLIVGPDLWDDVARRAEAGNREPQTLQPPESHAAVENRSKRESPWKRLVNAFNRDPKGKRQPNDWMKENTPPGGVREADWEKPRDGVQPQPIESGAIAEPATETVFPTPSLVEAEEPVEAEDPSFFNGPKNQRYPFPASAETKKGPRGQYISEKDFYEGKAAKKIEAKQDQAKETVQAGTETSEPFSTLTPEDQLYLFNQFAFPSSDEQSTFNAEQIQAWLRKSGISEEDLVFWHNTQKQRKELVTADVGASLLTSEEKQREYDIESRLKGFAGHDEAAHEAAAKEAEDKQSGAETEKAAKSWLDFMKGAGKKTKEFFAKRQPAMMKNFFEARDVRKSIEKNAVYSNREALLIERSENASALAKTIAELEDLDSQIRTQTAALEEEKTVLATRRNLANGDDGLLHRAEVNFTAKERLIQKRIDDLLERRFEIDSRKKNLEDQKVEIQSRIESDNKGMQTIVDAEVERVMVVTDFERDTQEAAELQGAIKAERKVLIELQATIAAYEATLKVAGKHEKKSLKADIAEMKNRLETLAGKLSKVEDKHMEVLEGLVVIQRRIDSINGVSAKLNIREGRPTPPPLPEQPASATPPAPEIVASPAAPTVPVISVDGLMAAFEDRFGPRVTFQDGLVMEREEAKKSAEAAKKEKDKADKKKKKGEKSEPDADADAEEDEEVLPENILPKKKESPKDSANRLREIKVIKQRVNQAVVAMGRSNRLGTVSDGNVIGFETGVRGILRLMVNQDRIGLVEVDLEELQKYKNNQNLKEFQNRQAAMKLMENILANLE